MKRYDDCINKIGFLTTPNVYTYNKNIGTILDNARKMSQQAMIKLTNNHSPFFAIIEVNLNKNFLLLDKYHRG